MPKQLTRAELLAEADLEYCKLLGLIECVPAALWKASSVNTAGWSLKDVLSHLVAWSDLCIGWCQSGQAGKAAHLPAAGYTWKQLPKLNQHLQVQYSKRATSRLIAEFHKRHAELVGIAEEMDEQALCGIKQLPWTGNTWSVAKYIRACTASHYRWASKHFTKTLRAERGQLRPRKPASPKRRTGR